MSTFVIKAAGLVGGAALVSGGSYWVYISSQPKDMEALLKRDGYSLANEDNAFKALSFDIKESFPELNIDSLSAETSVENAYSKLSDWCKSQYSRSLAEIKDLSDVKNKVIKFCVDSPITVRGKLIRFGRQDFVKDMEDDDYKVVFAIYKSDNGFIETIKKQKPNLQSTSDIEEGKSALKDWCSSNLQKKVKEDSGVSYEKIVWYCSPFEYKTVEEKLSKESWKKASDSDWEDLFDKWKNTTKLIDLVKKHDSEKNADLGNTTSKSDGGPKLKAWCEAGLKKNLYDSGVYLEEYSFIRSVCTKDLVSSKK